MEDKVKFVGIIYSCPQFMVRRPFKRIPVVPACVGVKHTATQTAQINLTKYLYLKTF
jgi:hypothetical protein